LNVRSCKGLSTATPHSADCFFRPDSAVGASSQQWFGRFSGLAWIIHEVGEQKASSWYKAVVTQL
jgi:hypothetical protein